jgi:hypothetical protein
MYVLDDVMSALDAHVGKEMFDNCIHGLLHARGKTVLLVTNQLQVAQLVASCWCCTHSLDLVLCLQYLPKCDSVVFIKNQTVAECGTATELLAQGKGFADLYMAHTAGEDASSAQVCTFTAKEGMRPVALTTIDVDHN